MAAYATAAMIRALESQIFKSKDNFPDATLVLYAETWADPIIDGRLSVAGYSTPFASAPNLAKILSAMIACAFLLESELVKHSARNVERARTLLDDADKIMDKIQAGSMDLGTVSQSDEGSAIYVDPNPEERPASTVFARDPEYWVVPTETRET